MRNKDLVYRILVLFLVQNNVGPLYALLLLSRVILFKVLIYARHKIFFFKIDVSLAVIRSEMNRR